MILRVQYLFLACDLLFVESLIVVMRRSFADYSTEIFCEARSTTGQLHFRLL